MSRNARYPGQDMVSLTLRLPLAAKHKLYEDSGGRPVPHLVKLIEGGGQFATPLSAPAGLITPETQMYIDALLKAKGDEFTDDVLRKAARIALAVLEDEADAA